MDAKLLTSQKATISGTRLFSLITCGLTAAAVILDNLAGQSSLQIKSLTVPLLISMVATVVAGYWAVPMLRNLKAGQVIREDGPQSHLKKAGTPTMGGAQEKKKKRKIKKKTKDYKKINKKERTTYRRQSKKNKEKTKSI